MMQRFFLQNSSLAIYEREMTIVPGFDRRRTPAFLMSHPIANYHFPTVSGSFTGTLVAKRWNRSYGLNCYFEAADDTPYVLCAWQREKAPYGFCPKFSDLDLSMIQLGAVLKVEYRMTRTAKAKWLTAKLLVP